jgi:hypothetical protein
MWPFLAPHMAADWAMRAENLLRRATTTARKQPADIPSGANGSGACEGSGGGLGSARPPDGYAGNHESYGLLAAVAWQPRRGTASQRRRSGSGGPRTPSGGLADHKEQGLPAAAWRATRCTVSLRQHGNQVDTAFWPATQRPGGAQLPGMARGACGWRGGRR